MKSEQPPQSGASRETLVGSVVKPQRKATKPKKKASIKLRRKIAGWRDDYLAIALVASAR
jgi:hypothetical protein